MNYLIPEVSQQPPEQTELMPLPRGLDSRVMAGDNRERIRIAVLKEMMPGLRYHDNSYFRKEGFLD